MDTHTVVKGLLLLPRVDLDRVERGDIVARIEEMVVQSQNPGEHAEAIEEPRPGELAASSVIDRSNVLVQQRIYPIRIQPLERVSPWLRCLSAESGDLLFCRIGLVAGENALENGVAVFLNIPDIVRSGAAVHHSVIRWGGQLLHVWWMESYTSNLP